VADGETLDGGGPSAMGARCSGCGFRTKRFAFTFSGKLGDADLLTGATGNNSAGLGGYFEFFCSRRAGVRSIQRKKIRRGQRGFSEEEKAPGKQQAAVVKPHSLFGAGGWRLSIGNLRVAHS